LTFSLLQQMHASLTLLLKMEHKTAAYRRYFFGTENPNFFFARNRNPNLLPGIVRGKLNYNTVYWLFCIFSLIFS
jgi:hypothetical protein